MLPGVAARRLSSIYLSSSLSCLGLGLGLGILLGSPHTRNVHGTHQIGIRIHVEVGTTMKKDCRVNGRPLGAIDSLEGSMCGITHKLSRSCMICITIHDPKNVIIQIQRVVKNE